MSVNECDARTEDLAAKLVGNVLADKCFKRYTDWVCGWTIAGGRIYQSIHLKYNVSVADIPSGSVPGGLWP